MVKRWEKEFLMWIRQQKKLMIKRDQKYLMG
jgi:hypothetical protein